MVILGPSTTWTYFTQVVPSTKAMGISAAYLFQAPAATYILLILGTSAFVVVRHRPSTSYALAVLTAVLAWPSLGLASLAMLAGLAPALRDGTGPETSSVRVRRGMLWGDASVP